VNIQLQSQTPYGNEDGLRDFFFVHKLVHIAVDAAATLKGLGNAANATLDSTAALDGWLAAMRKDDGAPRGGDYALRDWLQLHAALHQAEYAMWGLGQAPELGVVDFGSESQFYDWMLAHSDVHDTLNQAAGITT
jgi:hypothetical protein